MVLAYRAVSSHKRKQNKEGYGMKKLINTIKKMFEIENRGLDVKAMHMKIHGYRLDYQAQNSWRTDQEVLTYTKTYCG